MHYRRGLRILLALAAFEVALAVCLLATALELGLLIDSLIGSLSAIVLGSVTLLGTLLIFQRLRAARAQAERRSLRVHEVKNRLQRQREALLHLATTPALYFGSFQESIQQVTQLAAHTLRTDRVSVWLFEAQGSQLRLIDLFVRKVQEHSSGKINHEQKFPAYFHLVKQNKIIVAHALEQHPAVQELAHLQTLGIRALMDAPIYARGRILGVVRFCHTGTERTWKIDEQDFAASIADAVSILHESCERYTIEEDLRRRSLALESATDGIAILDTTERFSFMNQAHAQIYGYHAPTELLGQSWRVLYAHDEVERFERDLMPLFWRTGSLQLQARGKKKDGSLFHQEVSLNALSEGGLVCVVRDITQRVESERRLAEQKQFLRDIIDLDPNLIFVKDKEGRFTLVNKAVADLYGGSVEQMVGRKDVDYTATSEQVENFRNDDLQVIATLCEKRIAEERITDASGTTHVLQTVKRPLRLANGAVHILGVAVDISERKLLEERLFQAQKMEAIGRLAGGIAHDFNNLLTAILGYTSLLSLAAQGNRDGNRETLQIAGRIEKTAQNAAQLTQKLLGFARKGKHQNIPIDVHAAIEESIAILAHTLEKNISLHLKLQAERFFVRGDPVQLQQIMLNLAINARDAMTLSHGGSSGGKLEICTRSLEFSEHEAKPERLKPGKYLEISVADTGCGMSPEVCSRIFEPFYTTKPVGKGSGMGLAMVYGIVNNHGGALCVRSTPAHGSCFMVYLPLCSQSAAPTNSWPVAPHALVRGGRILIAEDQPDIREVTAQMLRALGYHVTTAADGQEAVDYCKSHHQEVDLLILDMVMPGMGARDCFREIRRTHPGIRAVLTTGYVNNNAVQEILNEGMSGFMQKPYHLSKLSEVVAAALHV